MYGNLMPSNVSCLSQFANSARYFESIGVPVGITGVCANARDACKAPLAKTPTATRMNMIFLHISKVELNAIYIRRKCPRVPLLRLNPGAPRDLGPARDFGMEEGGE